MIRVIVVDDHHLVRQGLEAIMERARDIELVGSAEDGQRALELIEKTPPDVVVADIAMPRLNGIQMIRHIRKLGVTTRVVILSMYSDETLVRQALKYGAYGYLLKTSVTEELLLAVRAASRGKVYISPEVSRAVLDDYVSWHSSDENPLDQLSPREGQVLQLVAEGHSNSKIGNLLGLSSKTVEKHRASMMSKLGVSDLPSLIRVAIKHRLIFIEE
jgi:DNA-binding NarL/FixJ family response regulator